MPLAPEVVRQHAREQEELVGDEPAHRHVVDLELALELPEEGFLSAPHVVEGQDLLGFGSIRAGKLPQLG
jgi:hypothetical protein